MQALHLGYPIGSLLAPLVALPFISDTSDDEENGGGDGGGDENATVSSRSVLTRCLATLHLGFYGRCGVDYHQRWYELM